MSKETIILNNDVTDFLNALNHPFRKEIGYLRHCILKSNTTLTENIKWNGPNYSFNNEDRITMKIQPPAKQVQLIFHRGAKKQEQPKDKLIANTNSLLQWKEKDRAIVAFKSIQDMEDRKTELKEIIQEWIQTKNPM